MLMKGTTASATGVSGMGAPILRIDLEVLMQAFANRTAICLYWCITIIVSGVCSIDRVVFVTNIQA
ncbi:hypothetical protein [Bradyrhizobium sp. STM 3562]|uniref:hypothetical protein n=1 Tax=Bradyrhizobium sp. STM 3562 TaxID=578924 RepID=UPI003890EE57